MGGSSLWLLLAILLVNRWSLAVAACSWPLLATGMLAAGVGLWIAYPALAEWGAHPLTVALDSAKGGVCVGLCLESWWLIRAGRFGRLYSVGSLGALLYLLALLFQSGRLPVSFELQTSALFLLLGALVLAYRMLSRVCELGSIDRYLLLPAIWLACWLGYSHWPKGVAADDMLNLRDTALLLAALPLAALTSLCLQRGLRRAFQLLRIEL